MSQPPGPLLGALSLDPTHRSFVMFMASRSQCAYTTNQIPFRGITKLGPLSMCCARHWRYQHTCDIQVLLVLFLFSLPFMESLQSWRENIMKCAMRMWYPYCVHMIPLMCIYMWWWTCFMFLSLFSLSFMELWESWQKDRGKTNAYVTYCCKREQTGQPG